MKKLVYENIPIGAKENSINSITHKQNFVNEDDFRENLTVGRFATLEKNYWKLNGQFASFLDTPQKIGYISTLMSDEDGNFSDDIVFTRIYDQKYSSPGFQIEFDANEKNYPTKANIEWYRDNEKISEKSFEINSAKIFFQNNVESFNKVIISFHQMNNSYRYLKITNISDGIIQSFYKDSFINLKILEEISSNSDTLSINTLNAELLNNENFDLLFLRTLPIKLYKDDNLIGSFFIKSSTKNKTYKVNCSDYIFLLDNSSYSGNFFENVDASEVINEILENIPYELDNDLQNMKINGYLSSQSKRTALQQVAFTIGAMVDCSRSDKIKIKKLTDDVISEIGKDRIFDINENKESITTHIVLTEHNYRLSDEKEELFNNVLLGNAKIIFNSPSKNLEIENGEILESHINYAVIKGLGGKNTILRGNVYEDITTEVAKENPSISFVDVEKQLKYDSSLVTNQNSLEVLNRLNFINKTLEVEFLLENEQVGDVVLFNNYKARILSLSFDFNSNKIVAVANAEVLDG